MHQRNVGEECKLLSGIRRASLLKYVSFCRSRLRVTAIVRYLPELVPILKFFGKHSFPAWAYKMSMYNQAYTPAAGKYVSLDLFLLQIHPEKIAKAFDSWVVFAKRVVPLILVSPEARSWKLNPKLIIHRRHWSLLSNRVLRLVKTIRLLSGDEFRNHLFWDDTVRAAARRAAYIYGGFAQGERCQALYVTAGLGTPALNRILPTAP